MKNEQDQNNIEERIPLKDRGLFQSFIAQKLGHQHGDEKMPEDWINTVISISKIIDDSKGEDHQVIRSLIMEGDYEKASEYVLKALEQEKKQEILH